MNWNIERIDRNHYLATSSENFFEFILDTTWKDSPEILIGKSCDMSKDNVIFIPGIYPTPEDDTNYAVIGDAYRYEKQDQCIYGRRSILYKYRRSDRTWCCQCDALRADE